MSSLRDLDEMSRDFGLGNRYFLLVGAILAVLLATLFVWGHEDPPSPPTATPPAAAPSATPSATGATSY